MKGHARSSSLNFGQRTGSTGSRGTPERPRLIMKKKSQPVFQDHPSPVVAENFFDFRERGADVDIWDEDNLVAKLKKDTGRRYN